MMSLMVRVLLDIVKQDGSKHLIGNVTKACIGLLNIFILLNEANVSN